MRSTLYCSYEASCSSSHAMHSRRRQLRSASRFSNMSCRSRRSSQSVLAWSSATLPRCEAVRRRAARRTVLASALAAAAARWLSCSVAWCSAAARSASSRARSRWKRTCARGRGRQPRRLGQRRTVRRRLRRRSRRRGQKAVAGAALSLRSPRPVPRQGERRCYPVRPLDCIVSHPCRSVRRPIVMPTPRG